MFVEASKTLFKYSEVLSKSAIKNHNKNHKEFFAHTVWSYIKINFPTPSTNNITTELAAVRAV